MTKAKTIWAVGIMIILLGLLLALWRPEGRSVEFLQVKYGVASSLLAAAILFLTQSHFAADPTRRMEQLLERAVEKKLPLGVGSVHLNVSEGPQLSELLKKARRVTFFGPEGLNLLQFVNAEAIGRTKRRQIKLTMYLPQNLEEIKRVDPEWKPRSTAWHSAVNVANRLQEESKLEFNIHYTPEDPRVSAVQVDESHYRITILFPTVPASERPILVLDPKHSTAQRYFQQLWAAAARVS